MGAELEQRTCPHLALEKTTLKNIKIHNRIMLYYEAEKSLRSEDADTQFFLDSVPKIKPFFPCGLTGL